MIDEKKLFDELRKNDMEFMQQADMMDCIKDIIDRQPKIGKWIPCSKRLPECDGKYICTQEIHSLSSGKTIGKSVELVEFCDGTWKRAKHLKVIAWQPLPEAYCGEMEESMGADLISRSKVLDIIRPRLNSSREGTLESQRLYSVLESVKELPAAYDVDKVLGQLEEVREAILTDTAYDIDTVNHYLGYVNLMIKAVKTEGNG